MQDYNIRSVFGPASLTLSKRGCVKHGLNRGLILYVKDKTDPKKILKVRTHTKFYSDIRVYSEDHHHMYIYAFDMMYKKQAYNRVSYLEFHVKLQYSSGFFPCGTALLRIGEFWSSVRRKDVMRYLNTNPHRLLLNTRHAKMMNTLKVYLNT